jgi:DNA-directed RNA polymerase specialized sigma24 family protein
MTARLEGIGLERGFGPLARLYEEHSARSFQLAYLLTGDHDLAEDLVQDAFVRLIGRFADLRNPQSFDAYLRRTIVTLSYGWFRRRRRTLSPLALTGSHRVRRVNLTTRVSADLHPPVEWKAARSPATDAGGGGW